MEMKMQLICLALLSAIGGICSQTTPESTDLPDYDGVEDLFSSTTASPGSSGPGSGDGGSVAGPGNPTTGECMVLMPADLIENCTVPEPEMVNSRAIESMSAALNQGICHSRCVERQTITLDQQQRFTGFPTWRLAYTSFFFSEDGINGLNCLQSDNPNDCQLPGNCPRDFLPLLDCKKGCETRLRGVESGCRGTCSSECQAECLDPTIFSLVRSCQVERYPLPCHAVCNRGECENGCGEGTELLDRTTPLDFGDLQFNDPMPPHPTQPPNVTHITDTLYRVDVEAALPAVTEMLTGFADRSIGYCTVVIKVDGGECLEKFYVLDDTNEVDLGDFACLTVNISYAIATAFSNVSNFSLPLTVDVINMETGVFPGQLDPANVNYTVEQDNRVGFFQQHIVRVSWEPPTDSQFAVGYEVSLRTGQAFCGSITEEITDGTATSHTFQLSAPNNIMGSEPIPPVTGCTYEMTIEVLPRNSLGGVMPYSTMVSTGQYELPSDSDLGLRCEDIDYIIDTDSYVVTLTVEMSSSFTPAIINVINYLRVDRFEVDERGEIPAMARVRLDQKLMHINATAIENVLRDEIPPRSQLPEDAEFHHYTVTVFWSQDVPRKVTNVVSADCVTRQLAFGIPFAPDRDAINAVPTVEALQPGEHRVTIDFTFTYDVGTRGRPTLFELWLADTEAPENLEESQTIGGDQRAGNITRSFLTSADTFVIYFQIRVLTRLLAVTSPWSEPLVRNISSDLTRPDAPGDDEYDVTGFTYSTAINDMGELVVTVEVVITHRIRSGNTIDEVQLCISEEMLADGDNATLTCPEEDSYTIKAIIGSVSNVNTVKTIGPHTVVLPRLGVSLYVQARGVSLADLVGDWSNPELIDIADIPPPPSIVPELISAELEMSDGVVTFRVTMDVTWGVTTPSPPPERVGKRQAPVLRESEMAVTQYEVVIGEEPIEDPYEDAPPSSIRRELEVSSSQETIVDTIELDQDNETDLVLYVQMRSKAGDATGSWSAAIAVDLTLTTTPVPGTSAPGSSLGVVIGVSVPIGLIAGVIAFLIVALLIYFCYKQFKLRHGLKGGSKVGEFNLWSDNYPTVPYIAPGMVKGKEVVYDEWEIPTTDVIVEDHLGEGAFGLVFKGTVRGPLRNPKLSSKVRQAIGLPVAIKLLKDTASNKEKSDFWTEIDMMKKISEGYCAHVVNMVGCVTQQEPLCLITEFVPHGDLLDYLRNQRKKNASRKRDEKYLRIQLEQQKKAYEDMKRQMIILQSAQSDSPIDRDVAGASGYADFPEVGDGTAATNEPPNGIAMTSPTSSSSEDSPDKPLLLQAAPYTDMSAEGNVVAPPAEATLGASGERQREEERPTGTVAAAPYLEPKGEYSHLDPSNAKEAEAEAEKEEDIYEELGDLDGNDLMQFAYQIATGMDYLASINIVHRDLACRNILVGEGKNLKITDFGLSREVEDVYVKTTKGRLPLKWMALESIEAREFTTSSDVWSYGIVLWEIGTMGGFPYPTIQNQDLLMMLKQGYRLEKPDNCAPEVYGIMLECWQEHPVDRPSFSQLRKKFSNLLLATTGDTYMELEVDEAKVYYTMGEEEEEAFNARKGSISSNESDSSAKKGKKEKKIEKPKWAQNPYVPTPSTFKDDHVHLDDEHYHVTADVEVEEEQEADEILPSTKIDGLDIELHVSPTQTPPSHHAPLTGSLSVPAGQSLQQTTVLLEDQMGIPLSFIGREKQEQHQAVQPKPSNPYVDDPFTKQPLTNDGELTASTKLGALSLELSMRTRGTGQGENAVSAL